MTDKFSPIDYDIFCGMDVDKKRHLRVSWIGRMARKKQDCRITELRF